jgi:hypothetical protein
VSIRENVASALVKEIISLGSVSYSGDIDDEILQKMLADVDVAQAIQLMTQSVTSKEWKIETDVPEYFETAENIQERFNNFNMVKLLENVLRSEIYKKSIFEIIYGKDDTGGTVIDDLVLLPNKYIKYNKDNGWMIKTRDSEIVIAKEPNRFLVCVNEERLDNLQGSSDLLPLVPVFKAKEHLESKLNAIIEKYGDIITVFAYEPAVETDPPEVIKARQKDVEAQAKDLKNAKGKDVLAVPSAGEKSLDDFIKFIKLDDLKPEIYQELLSEKSKAVQRYLLGSTLVAGVDGNSGNRALGEVHKEQQNYKIESKVKKIRDWIQKLIELDSVLYGYDPSKFYFKFVEEIDEKETLELEDQKAKTMTEKVNSIVKIMESGYAFTKDKIAEMLGVDVIDLVEVEKPEVSEFAKGKKKPNINKINEKRKLIERNQARFDRFVENNFKRWQKDVLKAVQEKIEKAKDISDFYDLNFNYENILEDLMLMSTLQGFDNAAMVDNGVTEFANTRTKTKNAALDNFLKKHPALYTDVEKEMDYSRQKYFWIKKVTDVNVTEKIFKQMSNTLENGGTFKDWKKDVDKILSESGLKLNEGYLKTVFRTNMNHAYNAGIHLKVDKYKERYPYYRYCGILDGREQQHTKELDGKIFKVGTPEADKYFPPNGFNCRCYTVSLTEDEVDPSEVVSGDDIGLDVGSFADNIGDVDYIETLENSYRQKVKIVEKIENEVLQKVENRVKINYKEADDKIIKKYENKTFEVFGYNPGDGELTKKEVESFKRYTGDEYIKINKYLRGEMKDDIIYDEYYGDYYGLGNVTSDIKRVLSKHKLEDDLKLYRGVSEPEFNYLKENNTFNQFISTSFDENIANDFMDEVENSKAYKVIVNAPKGTQGLYINGKGAYEDEKEFILNVGQKYKILKFEDGILHLEVMKNE